MKRDGFSLVELSIVLVILGLLVGGVLAGQSLIRAAELRSITSDFAKHLTAIHAFRDRYFALPGDMSNATAVWGVAGGVTGNDSTCHNTASTSALTCNGDADGFIDHNYLQEASRAWQHLANAGLIEGRYQGRWNSETSAGTSIPASKAKSGSGYRFFKAYGGSTFYQYSGNSIFLAAPGGDMEGGALIPADTWNLDTKNDDGIANTGRWFAFDSNSAPDCTDGSRQYIMATATTDCRILVKF